MDTQESSPRRALPADEATPSGHMSPGRADTHDLFDAPDAPESPIRFDDPDDIFDGANTDTEPGVVAPARALPQDPDPEPHASVGTPISAASPAASPVSAPSPVPVASPVSAVSPAAPVTAAAAVAAKPSIWSTIKTQPLALKILALVALAAVIIGGTWPLWNSTVDEVFNRAAPLPQGAVIVLPDNADPGYPNDRVDDQFAPIGDNDNDDPSGIEYVDPLSPETYRNVADDGTVTYTVPIDGQCPINNGAIGAPQNYRHACFHKRGGAVVYTTHAVRGPRVGGFENIGLLNVGQLVELDGEQWRVKEVEVFPIDDLPDYLFEPGNVMLLTCHLDAAVDAGAPFDKNVVASLEKMT